MELMAQVTALVLEALVVVALLTQIMDLELQVKAMLVAQDVEIHLLAVEAVELVLKAVAHQVQEALAA
jgi:hypothetical protein